ncbi:MAG: DedA family protein [Xanthobacteraceae bacterium]
MDSFLPTTIQNLIQTYGLWVLFPVVMLEGMGIPVPGETALVAAAVYAGSTNKISIASVVLVAALAAIIGDNIGYLIGRSIGLQLIVRYGRYVRVNESRLKIGRYLFLRHGGKIVLIARLITVLRAFVPLLAGINRMRWRYFLLMNAIGGICWASLFGGVAYLFGEEINRVTGPVRLLLLVAAIGLVIAGILFFRHRERELEQRADAALRGM